MQLITIEGVDQAGKSTQVKMLMKYLEECGYKVSFMHFPNYRSTLGKVIREYLDGELLLNPQVVDMVYLADITDTKEVFRLLDDVGIDFLILDRYLMSNYVYGMTRGSDAEWLMNISKYAKRADINFIIDITMEERAKRLVGRHLDVLEEDEMFQSTIRKNYLQVAGSFDAVILDGSKSPDEVHDAIVEALENLKFILGKKVS